ncbi:hypothetical protein GQ53DRAFT_882224 [Thozetella sp. PMI_491]|nr:hypothetical protein GQ53DRAFT_882224 [Thozetella sp. PMI_491]
MRLLSYTIAVLALGVSPSFSLPAPAVGGPRVRSLAVAGTALDARDFVPIVKRKKKDAAATSAAATSAETASTAAASTAAATAVATSVASSLVVKVGEEESEKIKTNGFFGSANPVQGGNVFIKLIMPTNVVGSIEPEYNSTVSNSITVVPKMASITPPTGMKYLDPLTFLISTATPPTTGDTMKVDYIYTEATKQAVDVTKLAIGKLDTATNQFVTDGVGELEFEGDENELSLTVADMNGEWAIFAPDSAVLAAKAD